MGFIRLLGLLGLPILAIGIIISFILAVVYGNYSILNNSISELGCKFANPYYKSFNLTLMISSVFLGCFYYTMCTDILNGLNSIAITIALISFLISAVGLFFVGLFSVECHPLTHFIFATITFVSMAVAELIVGISFITKTGVNVFNLIMIPIFATSGILFLVLKKPIYEWIFFLSIIIWASPLIYKAYVSVLVGM